MSIFFDEISKIFNDESIVKSIECDGIGNVIQVVELMHKMCVNHDNIKFVIDNDVCTYPKFQANYNKLQQLSNRLKIYIWDKINNNIKLVYINSHSKIITTNEQIDVEKFIMNKNYLSSHIHEQIKTNKQIKKNKFKNVFEGIYSDKSDYYAFVQTLKPNYDDIKLSINIVYEKN